MRHGPEVLVTVEGDARKESVQVKAIQPLARTGHKGSNRNVACCPAYARCILASGLSFDDKCALRSILDEDDQEQSSVSGTPLVVLTPEIAEKRVGDVLTDAPMISLLQVWEDACAAAPYPWLHSCAHL